MNQSNQVIIDINNEIKCDSIEEINTDFLLNESDLDTYVVPITLPVVRTLLSEKDDNTCDVVANVDIDIGLNPKNKHVVDSTTTEGILHRKIIIPIVPDIDIGESIADTVEEIVTCAEHIISSKTDNNACDIVENVDIRLDFKNKHVADSTTTEGVLHHKIIVVPDINSEKNKSACDKISDVSLKNDNLVYNYDVVCEDTHALTDVCDKEDNKDSSLGQNKCESIEYVKTLNTSHVLQEIQNNNENIK